MIDTTTTYDTYLARTQLFPKWKLYSYNPTTDTWAKIIDGTHVQTPTDLSGYVSRIDHSFDRMTITMYDEAGLLFHPDGGTLRTALQPGRIIRLKEGFEGLPDEDWIWTFSGTVEGAYSWAYQRDNQISIEFTAYSRANNQAFKRRNVSSHNYTVGSDWSSMFMNIVKDVMLLEDAEVVVPEPWGVLFDKNSNQIVNMPPWDAMEQLMFGIQAKPWFNGKGQLDYYLTTQTRNTETLPDDKALRRYESKGAGEAINKVIFTYLSNTLSRVEGPDQQLGSAIVTTGFFRPDQKLDVYYSDEHKTRSDNPRFIVVQSVNSGLLPVGTESMDKIDEFHSRITVEIEIWTAVLISVLLATYLTLAFAPFDIGFGIGTVTVSAPFGRIAQAVALVGILIIMSSIGTGQYEVWGTPYEMVYLEQQAIAIKSGIEFWQEREVEIRNDFVSTFEQAEPLVVNQLHYEVMKENPRTLLLRYDPRLEPGDILELSSSVRVYIESISRTIGRGAPDVATMTVNGYRTVL